MDELELPKLKGLQIVAIKKKNDLYKITNGNIRATVDQSTGLVSVYRVGDGQMLLRQLSGKLAACSSDKSVEACAEKAILSFSTSADEELLGGGQHMNTHGIAGRLPAKSLYPGQGVPRLDMKGGRWDFESCTVYSDSSGAEICVPWVLAAKPPLLSDPKGVCGPGRMTNTDQQGAVAVSDQNPEGLHATEAGCCARCAAVEMCTVWVHQPSVNRCWLMRAASPNAPVGHRVAADRTLGFLGKNSSSWRLPDFEAASPASYGMLWNMPNFGVMDVGSTNVTWSAHDPLNAQVDVFVATHGDGVSDNSRGAWGDIMHAYVDATGHSPMLPEWASGYWHSPMGHPTYSQSDVLEAAAGLHARNLSTALFIIDYFNWAKMGDYTFNPKMFPDPAAMVRNLSSMGTRIMVSAWPFVLKDGARASSAVADAARGLAAMDPKTGQPVPWPDSVCQEECFLYDPTWQGGRDFVFDMLHTGYIKYGIHNFWFDASEPESLGGVNHTVDGITFNNPLGQPTGALFHAGSNEQVGMMFPWFHTKMVYEGLLKVNPDEVPLTLARSGWAGTQRWGASNWNGDLQATWTNFKKTIAAGLNAQLSGLAWWTHDIGAIGGCDISSAQYRELLVRWFQFGLVSPIFRNHGSRPVEPWALQKYGESGQMAYEAIVKTMHVREQLRPYVMTLMKEVAETGAPVQRPLRLEFPSDPVAWYVPDQLMLGSRYLVAPVTDPGVRARNVYFPRGGVENCAAWRAFAPMLSAKGVWTAGTHANITVPFDELAMFECAS